jgi:ribonuclease Z
MISEIRAGRYTVRGLSLGGVYTSVHVPELDALFDVGVAPRSAASVARLFLSHGHVDHMGALPAMMGIRGLVGVRQKLQVYAPVPVAPVLQEMLAVISKMHRWPLEVDLYPMEPGQEIRLQNDLWVRAFKTFHPVPSLGYLFFRRVNKLRAEFQDLPGDEIGRRRKAGEDLFDVVDRHELAYATDTLPKVLDRSPELYKVGTLILECTFLDDRKSVAAARAGAHIHLDELLSHAHRFQNEALVLMHFSQLYKPREVVHILDRRLPPDLRERVLPLVPDADDWPG